MKNIKMTQGWKTIYKIIEFLYPYQLRCKGRREHKESFIFILKEQPVHLSNYLSVVLFLSRCVSLYLYPRRVLSDLLAFSDTIFLQRSSFLAVNISAHYGFHYVPMWITIYWDGNGRG